MPHRRTSLNAATFVILAMLAGCALPGVSDGDGNGSDTTSEPTASDQAMPDFAVVDVNVESARYLESISPRDYLGEVSAWYFGHST